MFTSMFFLVGFSFYPDFSEIFMKIYCNLFLRSLVPCSVLHLHYFAVFEFNMIKDFMFILKE